MAWDELAWVVLTAVALFVVLAGFMWKSYKRFRTQMKSVEDKLGRVEGRFSELAKDSSVLTVESKNRLSSNELEDRLNEFVARVFDKQVVSRLG